MLKNNEIALATPNGLFFSKIDSRAILFGSKKKLKPMKDILYFFKDTYPVNLCLADRVSGKCINLYEAEGCISVLNY